MIYFLSETVIKFIELLILKLKKIQISSFITALYFLIGSRHRTRWGYIIMRRVSLLFNNKDLSSVKINYII